MEDGEYLAYYLAKNPHIAAEVSDLPVYDAAVSLAKLSSVAKQQYAPPPKPVQKVVTEAPKPIAPAVHGGPVETPLSEISDFDAYKAARGFG